MEAGLGVTAGAKNGTLYNHYSLLAGIEKHFGLPRLSNAQTATPLPIGGSASSSPNPLPARLVPHTSSKRCRPNGGVFAGRHLTGLSACLVVSREAAFSPVGSGGVADGGALAAGEAPGVGAGTEFAGAVVANRVDADDLAVLGPLYRGGDDGHVDGGAGQSAPGGVRGAGEADHPGVGEAGHGHPGGGVSGAAGDRGSRSA